MRRRFIGVDDQRLPCLLWAGALWDGRAASAPQCRRDKADFGPRAGPSLHLCVDCRDGQVAAVMAPKGRGKHRDDASQAIERS